MFSEITMIDFKTPLRKRLESRKSWGPYKWTPTKPGSGRGFYMAMTGFEIDRHGSTIRLRIEPANDHINSHGRLRYINGYYCDDSCSDTSQPIIARLPNKRGFMAGWTMGPGMCASLEHWVYDDIEDAAQAAHQHASYDADQSRQQEYNERQDELEALNSAA